MLNCKLLLALAICSSACLCRASYTGFPHTQGLEITLPRLSVRDFFYRPTPEGYKFGYVLSDGTRYEERANIVDPNSPEAAAYIMAANERRNRPIPRGNTKNRKLSPKSLQSLAG